MGSNVEIVFSLASNLLQALNEDELSRLQKEIICGIDGDYFEYKYPALQYVTYNRHVGFVKHESIPTNHPSPFDYVDEAVLLLWEHWKPAMLRTYGIEDQAWRYQPQQVCFVLSDVWRDGRFLQEIDGTLYGVYVYCWDGFGVWVEPKFLEYGKVRIA